MGTVLEIVVPWNKGKVPKKLNLGIREQNQKSFTLEKGKSVQKIVRWNKGTVPKKLYPGRKEQCPKKCTLE